MTDARADAPDAILKFWFDEAGPKSWYASSPEFDALVGERFSDRIEREAARFDGGDHPWLASAGPALALILLFDQFPRNIWRGSARAFDHDARARAAARTAIEAGLDMATEEDRRAFFYMPFMHSEAIADQDYCIALARERLAGDGTLKHANKHREVIARFGRFPYRNDALGRRSTDEEIAYLEGGGYAPGQNRPANSAEGQ